MELLSALTLFRTVFIGTVSQNKRHMKSCDTLINISAAEHAEDLFNCAGLSFYDILDGCIKDLLECIMDASVSISHP